MIIFIKNIPLKAGKINLIIKVMIGWILTIIACILFLKCWNKVSGDDKKDKELEEQFEKEFQDEK